MVAAILWEIHGIPETTVITEMSKVSDMSVSVQYLQQNILNSVHSDWSIKVGSLMIGGL